MSESKLETVSLLVDNLTPVSEQALTELSKDEQLSDAWQRYHLIGDVMRGDTAEQLHLDLAKNIAQAIADEPTVLAPKSQTRAEKLKAKIVPLFKPLGQMAVAASAAGLMILGVQQANVADNTSPVPNQVLQTRPLAGIADPVSFNVQQPQPSAAMQQQARLEQQRRFQALLHDHQQQMKLTAQGSQKSTNDGEKNTPNQ